LREVRKAREGADAVASATTSDVACAVQPSVFRRAAGGIAPFAALTLRCDAPASLVSSRLASDPMALAWRPPADIVDQARSLAASAGEKVGR